MLKLAAIPLSTVLAVSAFAQKPPKPPKNPKPAHMVYVDDAKRVYYPNEKELAACNAATNLPTMSVQNAKSRGYRPRRCGK